MRQNCVEGLISLKISSKIKMNSYEDSGMEDRLRESKIGANSTEECADRETPCREQQKTHGVGTVTVE